LEQEDYDKDREKVIESCKKGLKAVITCCADFKDWKLTLEMIKKHKGFVFATAAIHPEYVEQISSKEVKEFIEVLRQSAKEGLLVGIGEQGLDFHWVKNPVFREKQKNMFIAFINLAKETNLPIVVHSRDAPLETIMILEGQGMAGKKVMLHQFPDNKPLPRIIENKWFVSIGPGILRSKKVRKIARDLPLNQIMLETDSPWFGDGQRGTPLNVKKVAEKIAEIKKISVEEVEKHTDSNAIKFFSLPIEL
jgi:TatD DNase family protein